MIKNMRNSTIPKAGTVYLGAPKGEKMPGRNQPHFRIESSFFSKEELEAVYGKEPKKLDIFFPKVSTDWIFESSYKYFHQGKLFCFGDGEKATRGLKADAHEVPCTCEKLGAEGGCKQRGEMRFALADMPFAGFFQVTTTSWESISQMESVLKMYQNMLGEQFWTIKFVLYKEEKIMGGRRQYILRMAIHEDYRKLLPKGINLVQSILCSEAALEEKEQSVDERIAEAVAEPQEEITVNDKPISTAELIEELEEGELIALEVETGAEIIQKGAEPAPKEASSVAKEDDGPPELPPIPELAENEHQGIIEAPAEEVWARGMKASTIAAATAEINKQTDIGHLEFLAEYDKRKNIQKLVAERITSLQSGSFTVAEVGGQGAGADFPEPPPAPAEPAKEVKPEPRNTDRLIAEKKIEIAMGNLLMARDGKKDDAKSAILAMFDNRPLSEVSAQELKDALMSINEMIKSAKE